MKKFSSIPFYFLFFLLSFSLAGYSQQVIGSFPTIDGGFEGHASVATQSSIANTTQLATWTINSTTSTGGAASLTLNSSGGRSGSKYITATNTGSSAIRLQSATASPSGAIVNATAYTVQFFYRTPGATAVTNFQRNISPDGTGFPGTYTALTMAATSGAWSAVQQVSQTSGSSANATKYGIGILRMNGLSATAFDIDDYVIYAGAADNTAPSSPGSVTVNGATTTSLNVSWGAASGGVDGGGYIVVRYAVSPNADNDPNQNGIYAVNNTTTNGTGSLTGTVVYIGTGTSFTNTGLSPATTYYYKVYTVDKAFNYSAEMSGNAATSIANPTTTSLSPSSATAAGAGFTLTVNGTNFFSGSVVTWGGSNRTTTFVSTTQVTASISAGDIASAGSVLVGVTNAGAASPNSNTQTFTINGGASQTITFGALPTKTYGDASFDPGATASSGLTVYYISSNAAVATVTGGNTINITGPGTCTITAKQDGDGTYGAAADVPQTLTVDPKTLTVTGAVAQNKLYDGGTAATITGYSIVETLVGSDVVTVSGGGTFASASVGTGISVTATLTLGGAQAAKYTLTQPTGLSADIIAPILAWDFNTKAGNEVSVTATTIDAGVSTSSITRGAGIAVAALPNGFSSTTYTVGANLATAITNNQYFQFTVKAVGGKQVSLLSLDANFRRSATGPNTFQWQYSLDGFATAGVNIGSPISYTLSTTTGDAQAQIDLSSIIALQNVPTVTTITIRLYPYGATNVGGTFALGLPTTPVNDLAIGGTISNAPTPDIAIADAHPAAGTADQGSTDKPIGTIYVDISTATAYLTGVSINTVGTYQSTDITNLKFWINGINSMTGATQIGTTQASVASGAAVSVSGLTTSIPSGSNRYIFVTASIASNAVVGRTISIGSTSFANIQFASGNKTGTDPLPASNAQTITQLDPTIAISDASLPASNINQNSTNQILNSIKLDITVTSATLTGITMTISGTYQTSDLSPNSFKFWVNSSNNLTGATQLGASQPIVGPGNTISVSGLSQSLNNNSSYYLLITADLVYNAVAGRTVIISSTDFSNIVFASANKTGTDPVPSGNTRTITAVPPSITIAGTATTSTTIGAPSNNNIIYQFTVAPTVNSAQLSQVSLPMTGTYLTGDIVTSGMKLWYNSTNSFGTATQIGAVSAVSSGSNLIIGSLSQAITMSTTGFFWLTADIKSSALAGRTIKVNTVTISAFTFTQGTVSGTPPGSGTFTFTPQPILTEVLVPQYMQGNTATNSTRIPYVYRVKISNLTPTTTYRYFNSVVNASDGTTGTGAGAIIYPAAGGYTQSSTQSLSTAGAYGTFTTNASGEYTGWFISEPTGNARFTPGASVNMRIFLNDGASGTTVVNRVTTTSSTTVINFVASAGAANGTGIRGNSSATAKNIVVLYDNVNGTGRPITAAAVESDGYAQSGNYPSFYTSPTVDGQTGAWGTIIPNTLPNGIRRIEQRDLATGNLLNCPAASYNGTWPSGVNTVNPTGGNTTILVIASTDAPLNTSASTWLGVSSDWNSPLNWICGVPNSATADVVIPSNSPIMPVVLSNITVRNISLLGSSTINIGTRTLTVTGAITGTGTLKGSQNSGLAISGAAGTLNFTSGFRELKTLTLNTGASATLGTSLDITSANSGGSVTVASGATLTTGGNLTLKSSVNGTAGVGTSAGTITGNVVVERYIPQNAFRAWRLLSVPVQGAQTFKQAWQEGQTGLTNTVPGFGTLLTNTTGTNGYDAASTGNSLLSFTSGAPGSFTAVTNTNNAMATNSGYFVYIRGNRSSTVSGGVFSPTATTLRTTGSLYQGTQTAITLPANQNVMVGNVYASAIDFDLLTRSGITSFKVWDPKIAGTGNTGAYVSFSASNGYDPTPAGGSYTLANSRIESGQAFIVNSTSGGSIQLTEVSKATSSRNVFRNATLYKQFKTNLYAYTGGGLSLADGNTTVYDSTFSNNIDNDDVTKINNFGENFGIQRNGVALALEARRPIVNADTIFYKGWNLKQQQYRLQFVPKNLTIPGLTAMLQDNFLATSTPLSITDTTVVDFTVTSNTASSATDRFRVVFKVNSILPVTFTSIKASEKNKKVNVEWKVAVEKSIAHYEIERSTNGINFEKIGIVKALGNVSENTYSFLDQQPSIGNNFYRIKSIDLSGKGLYSTIVKVSVETQVNSFTVNPNPIVNNLLNVEFKNQPPGKYTLRLVNGSGQILFTKNIVHDGDNNVKSFNLPSQISEGIYQLEFSLPTNNGKVTQKVILLNN